MVLSKNNSSNFKNRIRISSVLAIPPLTIMLIIILFYSTVPILTLASSNSTVMRDLTNGSSLEVILAPLQTTPDDEMQFRIRFLQPNKNELQEHIDFDFIILKNGEEVFRASNQTGQPNIPLHSIPGTIDIPIFTYDFHKSGEYTIQIPVFGILFNPIKPEEAEFNIRY